MEQKSRSLATVPVDPRPVGPAALRSSNADAQRGRSGAEGDGAAILRESRASPKKLRLTKVDPPCSRERLHPNRSSPDGIKKQTRVWQHPAGGVALPESSESRPARLRRALPRILSRALAILLRSARFGVNGWPSNRDLWFEPK